MVEPRMTNDIPPRGVDLTDEQLAASIGYFKELADGLSDEAILRILARTNADAKHWEAKARELEAERDEARRAVCERACHGRPGHESDSDYDTDADAARQFGWGYLYPEQAS